MPLPLSRTRAKWLFNAKSFIFDAADFQSLINLRDKHRLEDSMGFRGQWDEHRRFQIEYLKSLKLQPSDKFLEVGCGPLTAGIPLIDYLDPSCYHGVDVRSSVLDMSWAEVGKAGLSAKNPRLICSSDFASAELAGIKFDWIYSFSVLYHLSDEILDAYFAMVAGRLAENGQCIANVNTTIPSDKWLQFPFLKRSIETYEVAAAKHGLATTALGTLKENGFRNPNMESENPVLRFQLKQ